MRFDGIRMVDRCERCSRLMGVRAMSFFNEETICRECLDAERALIVRLRRSGVDPATLAGCGYLPEEDDPREPYPPKSA